MKDGSWLTVRPDWKQGWYIWTRYEITYTDGSTEQTYPVCVTGPTGNSGADGNGVKETKILYAKSTSNKTPPTQGWLTTTPAWEEGMYIWSKTVTTYTDGINVESAPVCISGSKGETGEKGESAVTIELTTSHGSVIRNYKGSTTMQAAVIYLGERIVDSNTLKSYFGEGANLTWKERTVNGFVAVDAGDPRVLDNGFSFVVNAASIRGDSTYICELVTAN